MAHWLGVIVSSDKVNLVQADVVTTGPIEIVADHKWKLQSGDRAGAYGIIYHQVSDYVSENNIEKVIIKASAISLGGTKKAHLEAAELRGVVIAAATSNSEVSMLAKAQISRNFGDRNVDDYLGDTGFWTTEVSGVTLRVGSREAALLILAELKSSQ